MNVVGIDPGKKGCMVMTNSTNGKLSVINLNFSKDNIFLDRVGDFNSPIDLIILEKTMGRGGWGATQNYNFGVIWGQIFSQVSYYRYALVLPKVWQAKICKGISQDDTAKNRTLQAYKRLFPDDPLKVLGKKIINDNMIDAFLISIYGQIEFNSLTSFNFTRE